MLLNRTEFQGHSLRDYTWVHKRPDTHVSKPLLCSSAARFLAVLSVSPTSLCLPFPLSLYQLLLLLLLVLLRSQREEIPPHHLLHHRHNHHPLAQGRDKRPDRLLNTAPFPQSMPSRTSEVVEVVVVVVAAMGGSEAWTGTKF